MTDETYLIKTAPQFDVHKWSDYAEINLVVDALFEEIKTLRASKSIRIRGADKVKRQLKVILIDLWAASKLSANPYRAVSLNKTDYGNETRYKKIFLKYDYFAQVVKDLKELKYISLKLGFRNPEEPNKSRRTRIKATPKLIDKIINPDYGVDALVANKGSMALADYNPDLTRETIILRDKDTSGKKYNIDYVDTESTNAMRLNVLKINNKLANDRIALHVTDTQYAAMLRELSSKKNKNPTVDFTRNSVYRVFNNASFEQGGRFYGAWWIGIPKEYRKYITIGRKPTVELDYSGHHFRILYSLDGLPPPDDPYDIVGFDREKQKRASLIMINAFDEADATNAMKGEGISGAKKLIDAIKARHSQISHHFFTGVGNNLMYQDSNLAEKVMLRMIDRRATILSLHDSFIVRNSYGNELEEIMNEEFENQFGSLTMLKYKKTEGEERSETQTQALGDLSDYDFEQETLSYSYYYSTWGY